MLYVLAGAGLLVFLAVGGLLAWASSHGTSEQVTSVPYDLDYDPICSPSRRHDLTGFKPDQLAQRQAVPGRRSVIVIPDSEAIPCPDWWLDRTKVRRS